MSNERDLKGPAVAPFLQGSNELALAPLASEAKKARGAFDRSSRADICKLRPAIAFSVLVQGAELPTPQKLRLVSGS